MSNVEDNSTRAKVGRSIQAGVGADDKEWLKTLHSSYVDRYQADLDRTWSTATWLVALAWTLFPAAVAFNQRLSPEVVVIYGLTSVALVLLWLAIASAHRVWAARSYDIVRAIERRVLGAKNDDDIRRELNAEHKTPRRFGDDPMMLMRWLILAGTVAGWVAFLVVVFTGVFPPPELPATPVPAG